MASNDDNKTAIKLRKLLEVVGDAKTLLIVMQDHPDPDAVASAAALRKLANAHEITCSLVHSGMVGRAENRALVEYLGINLRRIDEVNLESFDRIALVDTQPGTGNNGLPTEVLPDIVIDHHPIHKKTRSVEFTDIRSGYGATSTILCEYLRQAGITPEAPLATALLYGIRSDTLDLGRGARKADLDAHLFLYHEANLKMLAQIQHGEQPAYYYRLLFTGLANARTFGDCLFSDLGKVENPDMPGEIADLLVRRQGIHWCLCVALVDGGLLLSLRAREGGKDAGKVIKQIIGARGTGGGHHLLAGGQIPLEDTSHEEVLKLEEWLVRRFQKVFHHDRKPPMPLVKHGS